MVEHGKRFRVGTKLNGDRRGAAWQKVKGPVVIDEFDAFVAFKAFLAGDTTEFSQFECYPLARIDNLLDAKTASSADSSPYIICIFGID
jgi:hypothetical protein